MIPIGELPQLQSDSVSEQSNSTEFLRVCLVELGGRTFAIALHQIREVFEPESITPVPGMPPALVGITNLRGTIIPLADLRTALGIPISTTPKYAVLIHQDTQQVGILVEGVPEIHTVQSDHLAAFSEHTATDQNPISPESFKIDSTLSPLLKVSWLFASIEGMSNAHSP